MDNFFSWINFDFIYNSFSRWRHEQKSSNMYLKFALPPQADVIIINHVSLLNPQASSKVYKYSDIYDIHAKNLSRNFKYLHFAEFKDT